MSSHRNSSYEPSYKAIIDRLIERRRELGMSQDELAQRFQQNQSFISRVERRRRRIDVLEYVQLCRLLDLDPGAVLQSLEL